MKAAIVPAAGARWGSAGDPHPGAGSTQVLIRILPRGLERTQVGTRLATSEEKRLVALDIMTERFDRAGTG